MDKDKRCYHCGKACRPSSMTTIMHNQMHRLVCSVKCMEDFYKPKVSKQEPINSTIATLLEGMIKNGLGSSAKTIICHMLDLKEKSQYTSIPYDTGDFLRCQNVLDSIPNWREDLSKLSGISTRWAQLVLNWEEILIHCKEGEQKAANELIDRCIEL